MVIHYQRQDGTLCHQSYVGVSEVKEHSAATTMAFFKKLIPAIKVILPNLSCIHYISDSPASQYRNKSIVKFIAHHQNLFDNITCSWEYLETGHGKGPCDGIGGSVKKLAETAVKKGQIISGSVDFYNWAKSTTGNIKYLYVSPRDVSVCERFLKNATYVKGISSIHSLRTHNGFVYMRETSCFDCCRNALICDSWVKTPVPVVSEATSDETTDVAVNDADTTGVNTADTSSHDVLPSSAAIAGTSHATEDDNESFGDGNAVFTPVVESSLDETSVVSTDEAHTLPKYTVGSMVKALYLRKEYVGKIIQHVSSVNEYFISFMERRKRSAVYMWPEHEDTLWVKAANVVCQVTVDGQGNVHDVSTQDTENVSCRHTRSVSATQSVNVYSKKKGKGPSKQKK